MSGSTLALSLALSLALLVSCVISWRAHLTSQCQARALELLSTRGASPHARGEIHALNTLLSVGTLSLNVCAWSGEVELKWQGYVVSRQNKRQSHKRLGAAPDLESSPAGGEPTTLYIQTLSSSQTLARWRYASGRAASEEGQRGEWRPLTQLFELPLSRVAR